MFDTFVLIVSVIGALLTETYKLAQGMLQTRLKGFENYSATKPDYSDMKLYEDACVALRGLLESAAK